MTAGGGPLVVEACVALELAVMTAPGDYYEMLGVPRDADAKTIKNAFRQLGRRYHPDTSTEPDAEQRFKEIAEAYGVLSDPAKRARYDAQGAAGLAGATAEDLWGGIDFADIFGPTASAFGSLFERLFGQPAASPPRGQDVRMDLVVSLDQVLAGGQQTVTLRHPGPCRQCAGSGSRPGTVPRRCPECAGTGRLAVASRLGPMMVRQVASCPECQGRGHVIDRPCPACQASGRALQEEKVTILIPAGIPDGAVLRLAGRGTPSSVPGGVPGDAYLAIRTRADSRFRRIGADLWYDLHIQAPDAALGATAAVPASGGQTRVPVPPGIQSGDVVRIKGKGLPRYGGHGHGTLNVTVIVDIPRQLSAQQRQLYQQLQAEDAAEKSQAGGSLQPGAPRSGGKQKAGRAGRTQGHGDGLRLFAAVLLAVIGCFNLLEGIAAIASSHIFIGNTRYVASDLRAWGWAAAILGAVQLLAAAAVWTANQLARWLAVAVVGLNALAQMVLLPAHPVWSLIIIAADMVALWALCAYASHEARSGA